MGCESLSSQRNIISTGGSVRWNICKMQSTSVISVGGTPFPDKPRCCVLYQNVRGLKTKINDLYCSVLSEDHDLNAITETWCDNSVHDSELCDPRYQLFRRDRDLTATKKTRGGGVLLAVKSEVFAEKVDAVSTQGIEALFVRLYLDYKSVLVCVVYFSPGSTAETYSSFLWSFEERAMD